MNRILNLQLATQLNTVKPHTLKSILLPIVLFSTLNLQLSTHAQGNAFTYQGRLHDRGNPGNGQYDLIFQVFDAPSAGNSIGGSLAANGVPVANGLFAVMLDFGSAAFTGPARWLQIQVSPYGAGAYTTLSPRQPFTATPYANYAYMAGTVTNGAITSAQLAGGAVNTSQLAADAVDSTKIAAGQVVKTLNGLTDGVSLTQGANVTINTVGNSLQISAPAGGLALPYSGSASSSGSIFTLSNSASGPAGVFLGNVGIGTATPGVPFHVESSAKESSVLGALLEPNLSSNGFSQLYLGRTASANGCGTFTYTYNATDPALSSLSLGLYNSSYTFNLYGNGKVSIGTSPDPSAVFAVAAPNGNYSLLGGDLSGVSGWSSSSAGVFGRSSIGNGVYGYSSVSDGVYGQSSTGNGVYGYSSSSYGVYGWSQTGTSGGFARSSDGTLVQFNETFSGPEGSISLSGHTVSYNAFTGSHYAWTEAEIERGALVRLSGVNRHSTESLDSEIVYGIVRTTLANDPCCLGAYLSLLEPDKPAGSTNPHLVMAVGNGDMWVADRGNGDLEPGNFLISSDIPGCAMMDDPKRFPIGYICARAAEGVKWSEVQPDAQGLRRKRTSVLFESFVRDSRGAQSNALAQSQQSQIDALEAEVKSLRTLRDRLAKLEAKLESIQAIEITPAVARKGRGR